MIKPIRHYFINWINGMKISKDNFVDLQYSIQDNLRDIRATMVTSNNFGMLPAAIDNKEALEYNLFVERPNQVNVELFQCRAVLPNGNRVELIEGSELNNSVKGSFEIDVDKEESFFVMLSSDTQNGVPFGEPNEEETPPRLPYIRPQLELHLIKSKDILKGGTMAHAMPIAMVNCTKGEIEHTQHYIPPCSSVAANPSLREFHRKLVKLESEIERYAFEIFLRLKQRDSNTSLAEAIGFVCQRIIAFSETERDALNIKLRDDKPLEIVLHSMRFARNLKNSLDLLPGSGKDEVLSYYNEVIGKNSSEYMAYLDNVINLEYNHYTIHSCLQSVLQFSKIHLTLFKELSSLDYIGKKKKSDVFVAEKKQDLFETKPKKESGGTSWDW